MAEGVATVVRALVGVAATVGEQQLDWIAAGSPEALRVTMMLLTATGARDRALAVSVLDFWTTLQVRGQRC